MQKFVLIYSLQLKQKRYFLISHTISTLSYQKYSNSHVVGIKVKSDSEVFCVITRTTEEENYRNSFHPNVRKERNFSASLGLCYGLRRVIFSYKAVLQTVSPEGASKIYKFTNQLFMFQQDSFQCNTYKDPSDYFIFQQNLNYLSIYLYY